MIYFPCYPHGDRGKVQVVDLDETCKHEYHDWDLVTDNIWDNLDDCLAWTYWFAWKHKLTYVPFESRYSSDK